MTFLAPGFLVGLVGAVVPVLIHLLARRTRVGRRFSSLLHLVEMQQTALRWLRIRQRQLLALRIGFIVLVVLALSRPICGTPRMDSMTMVILDRSASMSSDDGGLWRKAISYAESILISPNGSRHVFATAGAHLDIRFPAGSSPETIKKELDSMQPTGETLRINDVVQEAIEFAHNHGAEHVRAVLISDFQPSNWRDIDTFDSMVELDAISLSGCSGNLSIGNGRVRGILANDRGAATLQSLITPFGEAGECSCTVLTRWDGAEEYHTIYLDRDEIHLSLPLKISRSGLLVGEQTISDTRGSLMDNRMEFALYVPKKRRVLVLGDDSEETRRVTAVLDPFEDGTGDFQVLRIRGPNENSALWEDLSAIIVLPGSKPAQWLGRIVRKWENGVGVMIVNSEGYMSTWTNDLIVSLFGDMPGDPPMAGPGEPTAGSTMGAEPHPIVEAFEEVGGIAAPTVWKFRSWPSAAGTAVLSLPQRRPLLLESGGSDGGRALLWLTGFTPPWSDWSSRSSFVVVLRRAITYACEYPATRMLAVGEELSLPIPCSTGQCRCLVRGTNGSEILVVPEFSRSTRAEVRVGPFWKPGIYTILCDDKIRAILHVTIGSEEQEVASPAARPSGIHQWYEVLRESAPFEDNGFEATTILLLLALGLLITEGFVAGRLSAGSSGQSDD